MTFGGPHQVHPRVKLRMDSSTTSSHSPHAPTQINAVHQTILNLAVRARLVEQDPNDEPAVELLKRIAERLGSADLGAELAQGWKADVDHARTVYPGESPATLGRDLAARLESRRNRTDVPNVDHSREPAGGSVRSHAPLD